MDCGNSGSIRNSETAGTPGIVIENTRPLVATSDQSGAQTAASLADLMELGSRKKRPAPRPPTVLPQAVTPPPGIGVGHTLVDLDGGQAAPRLSPQSVPQPAPRGTGHTGSQVEVQTGAHGADKPAPRASPRMGHRGTSHVGLDVVPQATPRTMQHVGLLGEAHIGPQALPRTSSYHDLNAEQHNRSQTEASVSRQLSGPTTVSPATAQRPIPSRPSPPRLQLERGHTSNAYDKAIHVDLDPEPKAISQINIGAISSQGSGGTTPVFDGMIPILDDTILDDTIVTNLGKSKRKAPAAPQTTSQTVHTSSRSPDIPLVKFRPTEVLKHSSSPVISERLEEMTGERYLRAEEVPNVLQFASNNFSMLENGELADVSNASENDIRTLSAINTDEPTGVSINKTPDQAPPIAITKAGDGAVNHDALLSTEGGRFERHSENHEGLVDLDEIAFDETEVIFVNPESLCLYQGANGPDIAMHGLEAEHTQDIQSQIKLQSPQRTLPVQSQLTDFTGDGTLSDKNHEEQSEVVNSKLATATPDSPKPGLPKPYSLSHPLENADIGMCASSKQVLFQSCNTSNNLQTVEDNNIELYSEKNDLLPIKVQTTDDVRKTCSPSKLAMTADKIQATSKAENVVPSKTSPGTTPLSTPTADLCVSPGASLTEHGSLSAKIQPHDISEHSENLWTGTKKTNSGSPPVCLNDANKTTVPLNNEIQKASGSTLLKHATEALKMYCAPSAIKDETKHKLMEDTCEIKHADSSTDVNCNVINAIRSENFHDSNSEQLARGTHAEFSANERTNVELSSHDGASRETNKDRISVPAGNFRAAEELKSSGGTVQPKKMPPPIPTKGNKGASSKTMVSGRVSESDCNGDTIETITMEQAEKAKNEDYPGIYQYLLKSLSSSLSKDSSSIRKLSSDEDKCTATDHNVTQKPNGKVSPPVLSGSIHPTAAKLTIGDSLPTHPKISSETATLSRGTENVEASKQDQPTSSIYQILKKSFPPPTSKRPYPGKTAQKDALAFHLIKNQESALSKEKEGYLHISKDPERSIKRSNNTPTEAIQHQKLPISKNHDNAYQKENLGIPEKVGNQFDMRKNEEPPSPLPVEAPPPLPQQPPPPLARSISPFCYDESMNDIPSQAHGSVSECFSELSPALRSDHAPTSTLDKLNESSGKKSPITSRTCETPPTFSSPKNHFSFFHTEETESVTDNSPDGLKRGKKLSPALLPKPYCRPLFAAVGKMKESNAIDQNVTSIDKASSTEKVKSSNQEQRVTDSLYKSLTNEDNCSPKGLATSKSLQPNSGNKDRYQPEGSDQTIFRSATEEEVHIVGRKDICERKEYVITMATRKYSEKEAHVGRVENRDQTTSNGKTPGIVDDKQNVQTIKREHQHSSEQESVAEEADQRTRTIDRPSTEKDLRDDEEIDLRQRTIKQAFTEQNVVEERRSINVKQTNTQMKNTEEEEIGEEVEEEKDDDDDVVVVDDDDDDDDDDDGEKEAEADLRPERRLNQRHADTRLAEVEDCHESEGINLLRILNNGVQKEDRRSKRIKQRSTEDKDSEEEEDAQTWRRINQRLTHEEDVVEEDYLVALRMSQQVNEEKEKEEEVVEQDYQAAEKGMSSSKEYIEEKDDQRPIRIHQHLAQGDAVEEEEAGEQKEEEEKREGKEEILKTGRNDRCSDENEDNEKEAQLIKKPNKLLTMKRGPAEKEKEEEEDGDEEEEVQRPRAINNCLTLEEDTVQRPARISQQLQEKENHEEEEEEDEEEENDRKQIRIGHRLQEKEDIEEDENPRSVNHYSKQEQEIQYVKAEEQRRGRRKEEDDEEEEEVEEGVGRGRIEELVDQRRISQSLKEETSEGETPSRIDKHSAEAEDVQQDDYKRNIKINQVPTEAEDSEKDGFEESRVYLRQREEEDAAQKEAYQHSVEEVNVQEKGDDQKTKVTIKPKDVDGAPESHDAPDPSIRSLSSTKKDEKKQPPPKVAAKSSIYQLTKKSSGFGESIAKDRHSLAEERQFLDDNSDQKTVVCSSQFQNQAKNDGEDESLGQSVELLSSNESSPTKSSSIELSQPWNNNQSVYAKGYQAKPSDTKLNSFVQKETHEMEKLDDVHELASSFNRSMKHPPTPAAKPIKLFPIKNSFEGEVKAHDRSVVTKRAAESLLRSSNKQGSRLPQETEEENAQKRLSDRDSELYAMASSKTRVFPALSQKNDARPAQPMIEVRSSSTTQKQISQKTGPEQLDEAQPTKSTRGRFLFKSAEHPRNDQFSATDTTEYSTAQEQYSFYFSFPEIQNDGNTQEPKKLERQSHSVSDEPLKTLERQSHIVNAEPVKFLEKQSHTFSAERTYSAADGDSSDQSKIKKQERQSHSVSDEPSKMLERQSQSVSAEPMKKLEKLSHSVSAEPKKIPEKQLHSVGAGPKRTYSAADGDSSDQSMIKRVTSVKDKLPTNQSFKLAQETPSSEIKHRARTTTAKDVPFEQMKDRLRQWHVELQQDSTLRTKGNAAVSAVRRRSNVEDVGFSSNGGDLQQDQGKVRFRIDLERSKAKRYPSIGAEDTFSEISTNSFPRQPPTYFDVEERRLRKTSSGTYNNDRPEHRDQPVRHPLPQAIKENNDFFFTIEEVPIVKVRYGGDNHPQESSSFRVASSNSRTNSVVPDTQGPKSRTSTSPAQIPCPKPRTSIMAAERGSTSGAAAKPPAIRITSNFRMQSATELPYVPSSQRSYRYPSQTATRGVRATELDARWNSLDRRGRPGTFYE